MAPKIIDHRLNSGRLFQASVLIYLCPYVAGKTSGIQKGQSVSESFLPPSRFLRRAEAAKHIHEKWGYPCSPRTLAKYAVVGGGPVFRRAGRFPLYSIANLDDWVASKLGPPMRSTSDLRRKT